MNVNKGCDSIPHPVRVEPRRGAIVFSGEMETRKLSILFAKLISGDDRRLIQRPSQPKERCNAKEIGTYQSFALERTSKNYTRNQSVWYHLLGARADAGWLVSPYLVQLSPISLGFLWQSVLIEAFQIFYVIFSLTIKTCAPSPLLCLELLYYQKHCPVRTKHIFVGSLDNGMRSSFRTAPIYSS